MLMFLTSCGISRPSTVSKPASDQKQRNQIVEDAGKYLGSPYKYGGNSRKGLDCSGLVHLVYLEAGIELPRTSAQQFRTGKSISLNKSQKGDLVFFTQKGKLNHVGIITKISKGSIWVIHSTTSRGVISEDILASSYWNSRIKGVRDVINNR